MLNHSLFDPIVNQLGFQEKLTSQRETGDTLRVGHKLCIICWFYAVVRISLIHSNDIIQVTLLSICTWFLKDSISQNWFLNLIFELFWTGFLQATQAVKIKFEIEKNQIQKLISWNRDFKNQVQIDRRFRFRISLTMLYFLPIQNLKIKIEIHHKKEFGSIVNKEKTFVFI